MPNASRSPWRNAARSSSSEQAVSAAGSTTCFWSYYAAAQEVVRRPTMPGRAWDDAASAAPGLVLAFFLAAGLLARSRFLGRLLRFGPLLGLFLAEDGVI